MLLSRKKINKQTNPENIFLSLYILLVYIVKIHSLATFRWLTLPTVSCLILYSLFLNLSFLYLLVIRSTIPFLSRYNQDLLFSCDLFILSLVLIVLIWDAIKSDSVSLLKFPLRSHTYVGFCYSFDLFF